MKIGVMSDTHLRSPDETLDYILGILFAGTDMILHAGDIVTRSVLDYLEAHDVVAVCGNMDDYEIAGHVPQQRVLEAEGTRIGLIHGWGSKQGLEWRILERFERPRPDLIVYGHTHKPFWGKVDDVMMFNPGSAAAVGLRNGATVGILEIREDGIDAEHRRIDR
jgi:hypothetical protein